jgi:light-regulated signal transduction histidine kinase (bacteriophytochrome)
MFQRLHTKEKYPGTGVGLAIVRKALARMGGQAGLESEPGEGRPLLDSTSQGLMPDRHSEIEAGARERI